MIARHRFAWALVLLVLGGAPARAAEPETPVWVTLGTQGGPMPSPTRSQPANLLSWDGGVALVDAGDGAVEQLARAGVPLPRLRLLFLSHLHFDHTGGVAALIALRWQTEAPGKLAIYGPPGTRSLVKGILAAMREGAATSYGFPGVGQPAPAEGVEVHELAGGESLQLGELKVVAMRNSHYSFAPGSREDRRFRSLSFRFDLPGRSIVYTGDTGPSEAVERLGKGADLLVAEMADAAATMAQIDRANPHMSPAERQVMARHMAEHHLSPEKVADMATAMGVSQVVATHLAVANAGPDKLADYARRIAAGFAGKVRIAADLDRF